MAHAFPGKDPWPPDSLFPQGPAGHPHGPRVNPPQQRPRVRPGRGPGAGCARGPRAAASTEKGKPPGPLRPGAGGAPRPQGTRGRERVGDGTTACGPGRTRPAGTEGGTPPHTRSAARGRTGEGRPRGVRRGRGRRARALAGHRPGRASPRGRGVGGLGGRPARRDGPRRPRARRLAPLRVDRFRRQTYLPHPVRHPALTDDLRPLPAGAVDEAAWAAAPCAAARAGLGVGSAEGGGGGGRRAAVGPASLLIVAVMVTGAIAAAAAPPGVGW